MDSVDLHGRLNDWLRRWSDSELPDPTQWISELRPGSWAAGENLIRAGERSDTLYLLEEGLVRLFYTTPDGRERNKAFYCAGDVTGPVSAAISSEPAPFSIQCLEPTTALCFQHRDFVAAAEQDGRLAKIYTNLLASAFIRNEQREAMLLTCNAEQRYQWLLAREPELPARVPQFHLASYLGLDPVSLSRLKAKLKGGDS